MELTRQEAIENHRTLWHEIARRTREEKRIVNKKEVVRTGEKLCRNCYLCEYSVELSRKSFGNSACYFCPLCKPETMCCLGGLYDRWLYCESYKKAAEFADQIAELPEVNFNGVFMYK